MEIAGIVLPQGEVFYRLMFLTVFLVGLGLFLWFDRNKISRHYFLFYRRTKKGLEEIDKVAKRFPRFWKYYGSAGVVAGILSLLISLGLIVKVFFDMAVTQSTQNGPSLLLPGLNSQTQFQAGVSFLPVEYWIIGVGVLMFVHEMSHGVVARAEGFELNSVGWILIGILPGAFVEPKGERMLPGDEEDEAETSGMKGAMWEGGTWKGRLKVLCAGSFANYITAAIFLLLAIGLAGAVTQSSIQYQAQEDFPAANAGMTNGTLIQINGEKINNVEDVKAANKNVESGDQVSLWTSEGNFTITTVEKEDFDGGYIGIRIGPIQEVSQEYSSHQGKLEWTVGLLRNIFLLNLLIGLFNMLPFKPLDGGLVTETVVSKFLGEDKVEYVNQFSMIGWALILTALIAAIIGF